MIPEVWKMEVVTKKTYGHTIRSEYTKYNSAYHVDATHAAYSSKIDFPI